MRGKEAVINIKADGSSCMELKEQDQLYTKRNL